MQDLKSGDLCIKGSDKYSDYREQLINFGSDGVIRSNNREDQRKRIKYNHLVANTIIFYNVYHMSEILHGLSSEGYDINKDIVASLAPYMTSHINRFGKYSIDKNIKIPELKFDIDV